MSVIEERKALDQLSGAYRRLTTTGRRRPPPEPPEEGQAQLPAPPQPAQAPPEPRQPS